MWVLWVAMFFNLLCFCFLGHLIVYHIRLQRMNLTTFEYIKLSQKRKESKIVKRVKQEQTVEAQEAAQYLEIQIKNS